MRWDKPRVHELAIRSQAEYLEDPEKGLRDLENPEHFTAFRESEIEHSVATYSDRHILTFRGTEPRSIADWVTDAKIVRKRIPGARGTWHRGIADAVSSVSAKLLPYISDGRPVELTGHSLGAGLATEFAAFCIGRGGPTVSGGATFGSLRVANCEAAEWFMEKRKFMGPLGWWRVVNNNDIVTRIPFSVRGGYRHVGSLAYIDRDREIVFGSSRWYRFKDRVKGRFESLLGGEPDVHEVPGLSVKSAEWLIANNMGTLEQVSGLGDGALQEAPGVGPAMVLSIRKWAEHRAGSGSSFVFDGTLDHGMANYVEPLAT